MSLRQDARGAVFVEHMIAYLPLIFFFLATWQLLELCAAHLIVKRAASAAARAAVVVIPDDPGFYTEYTKEADVRFAAEQILGTSPHISNDFTVGVVPQSTAGHEPVTATVSARFHCFAGWASLVCGAGTRQLVAKATYVNQGASYDYDM